jgi:hypothetical protein
MKLALYLVIIFAFGGACHSVLDAPSAAEVEGTINIVSIYDENKETPTAVEINYDGDIIIVLQKEGHIALHDRVEKESIIALYEFFQTLIDIVEASRSTPTPAPANFP